MEHNLKKHQAVILLSGGLDSSTTLAFAVKQGFFCHALTFVYGQRHRVEIEASKKIAESFNIAERHRIIQLDPQLFDSSSLTSGPPVPLDRDQNHMSQEIPSTYVPARNTVFLAMALAYAENVGAFDLFIGANAVDYSGYPDCRPEFIQAFEKLANLATQAGVGGQKISIHAPLMNLNKPQIIQLGLELGVDYSLTWSCYNPSPEGIACGRCDSCTIRKNAFRSIGKIDPIPYQF
jgi:7-cyano-7-deazaguanine synthase